MSEAKTASNMHSEDFSARRNRYSAKSFVKPVPFICQATRAQQVHLMGDFNEWNPTSHPMNRQPDGAWRLEVPLNHGHHLYLFVVDGQPTLDPNAQGIARNYRNEQASLVAVS